MHIIYRRTTGAMTCTIEIGGGFLTRDQQKRSEKKNNNKQTTKSMFDVYLCICICVGSSYTLWNKCGNEKANISSQTTTMVMMTTTA